MITPRRRALFSELSLCCSLQARDCLELALRALDFSLGSLSPETCVAAESLLDVISSNPGTPAGVACPLLATVQARQREHGAQLIQAHYRRYRKGRSTSRQRPDLFLARRPVGTDEDVGGGAFRHLASKRKSFGKGLSFGRGAPMLNATPSFSRTNTLSFQRVRSFAKTSSFSKAGAMPMLNRHSIVDREKASWGGTIEDVEEQPETTEAPPLPPRRVVTSGDTSRVLSPIPGNSPPPMLPPRVPHRRKSDDMKTAGEASSPIPVASNDASSMDDSCNAGVAEAERGASTNVGGAGLISTEAMDEMQNHFHVEPESTVAPVDDNEEKQKLLAHANLMLADGRAQLIAGSPVVAEIKLRQSMLSLEKALGSTAASECASRAHHVGVFNICNLSLPWPCHDRHLFKLACLGCSTL